MYYVWYGYNIYCMHTVYSIVYLVCVLYLYIHIVCVVFPFPAYVHVSYRSQRYSFSGGVPQVFRFWCRSQWFPYSPIVFRVFLVDFWSRSQSTYCIVRSPYVVYIVCVYLSKFVLPGIDRVHLRTPHFLCVGVPKVGVFVCRSQKTHSPAVLSSYGGACTWAGRRSGDPRRRTRAPRGTNYIELLYSTWTYIRCRVCILDIWYVYTIYYISYV